MPPEWKITTFVQRAFISDVPPFVGSCQQYVLLTTILLTYFMSSSFDWIHTRFLVYIIFTYRNICLDCWIFLIWARICDTFAVRTSSHLLRYCFFFVLSGCDLGYFLTVYSLFLFTYSSSDFILSAMWMVPSPANLRHSDVVDKMKVIQPCWLANVDRWNYFNGVILLAAKRWSP